MPQGARYFEALTADPTCANAANHDFRLVELGAEKVKNHLDRSKWFFFIFLEARPRVELG